MNKYLCKGKILCNLLLCWWYEDNYDNLDDTMNYMYDCQNRIGMLASLQDMDYTYYGFKFN